MKKKVRKARKNKDNEKIKIRKARLADVRSCVKIGKTPELTAIYAFTEKQAIAYLTEYVKKGVLLIAEIEKEIVGFLGAESMLGKFFFVDSLAVKKEKRGYGIGTALFQQLRKECKKRKMDFIYLTAPLWNKKTIKFYEQLGLKKGKGLIDFYEKIH